MWGCCHNCSNGAQAQLGRWDPLTVIHWSPALKFAITWKYKGFGIRCPMLIQSQHLSSLFMEIQLLVSFNITVGMFGLRSALYIRSFILTPSSFCILFLFFSFFIPNICQFLWNHRSVAFDPPDYTNSIWPNSRTATAINKTGRGEVSDQEQLKLACCYNSGAAQNWALRLQNPQACPPSMVIMPSFSYLVFVALNLS